jgi:hypothetical protein
MISITFKDGSGLYTETANSFYVNFEKNEFVINYESGGIDIVDISCIAYMYINMA